MKSPIVFFDGVCGLCNGFINWLFRVDRAPIFKVAALQGETARKLISEEEREKLESVMLIKDGKVFQKSDAVLEILNGLGYPWKLGIIFYFIPKFIRDGIYSLISKNRYILYRKLDSCRLPSEEERMRFLP